MLAHAPAGPASLFKDTVSLRPAIASLLLPALCALLPAHAAPPACVPLDPVPQAVFDAPLLVLGDVHGTREVPAFVAGYLCAALRQGRALTLAVELPSSTQDAFDAFMASPGSEQDLAQLTGAGWWRNTRQDGRTSAAMLALLGQVRFLRAGGADIRLVPVDAELPPELREAAMAARLRAQVQPGRQLVALVGALHAVRSKGNRFNPQFESAAYLLGDQRPLSLTVGTAGGDAWICRGATPQSCGPARWDINRVAPAPATPFSLAPPSPQFDGVFYVGVTTASPPAVPAQ